LNIIIIRVYQVYDILVGLVRRFESERIALLWRWWEWANGGLGKLMDIQ